MTEFKISPELRDAYIDYALNVLAKRIGLSESQSRTCAEHFNGITTLLDNSELKVFNPVLRIQGSNRLGTAVRCYNNEEGFDVDIVCELQNILDNYTPKMVKEAVGKILLESGVYGDLIPNKSGGKRCWTIEFKDGTHADVLPSVVNEEYVRAVAATSFHSFDEFGIRITDKTRILEYLYETDRSKWLLSNPIGFAEWFFSMAYAHEAKHKNGLTTMVRASVEPFPKWKEEALILQKIVRILKRHRDVMFDGDEKKPISMIITVLAAKAYANAPIGKLFDTTVYVASHLVDAMDIDFRTGKRVVLNPVNGEENFADRWISEPDREQNFYRWVRQLQEDIQNLRNMSKIDINEAIKKLFGESAGKDTITEITKRETAERLSKGTKITTAGVIGTVGTIAAQSHNFYGK